jgi:hypothetical protein
MVKQGCWNAHFHASPGALRAREGLLEKYITNSQSILAIPQLNDMPVELCRKLTGNEAKI